MELGVKGNNTSTLSKFHRNSIGFIYRRRSVCKKLIEFRSRGPIRGLINTEERKESGWRTRRGENVERRKVIAQEREKRNLSEDRPWRNKKTCFARVRDVVNFRYSRNAIFLRQKNRLICFYAATPSR